MISPSTAGRRDSDDRSERHFEALGREQCLDLLASNHLGRVAWQAADLPQILPVTYAMYQGSAYFRTTPDGILSELAQPTRVALEVDELDQQTRSGWSIVLQGRTSAVTEPDALAGLWAADSLVPWAGGHRTLFICIRPDRVSGRIVRRST
ncbi:MAG TPA: pyridoxamine 5'-phosphate oxidase family protein [Propionibacteriaceae bacterium]|jgi:nitroimidazol reductase NimA-like FMN-containing flavoprotein (pyridoxamine 5'-phosphate oxidase superfamily)|nr:pyridoxamine 5'-phosphate oxidase family protein [Propionibacteriaceae bacterium]